jgi:diketogulonate reductase-like aldo/keto reductase
MTALSEHFTLANRVQIPKIGFGTWQIDDGADAYDAVAAALQSGYRHIDTARAYGNEASVARAVAASGIPRDDIFVTTKLPAEVKSYEQAHSSFDDTVAALRMDYVDLYLIHAPWPWDAIGTEHNVGNAEAWRAMEEILAEGRTRAIGVSNFDVTHLETLLRSSTITPHVNQIEYYVGNTQRDTTAYCQANGILVEGYSPLATGAILDSAELRSIAGRYGKSVAQLCIRYVLQNGVLPLPKSVTPSRIIENADIDFDITDADMALLDALD